MRNPNKVALGAAAAFTCAGALVGVTSTSASASSSASPSATSASTSASIHQWQMCDRRYLVGSQGYCLGGYTKPEWTNYVEYLWNDTISSIKTNEYGLQTWNNANYTGTYGFFDPMFTWSVLNYPYNDAISSYGPAYN
ncbi:hypothetical protein [Streptomyces cadmiisoli]|uniref:hypothetical protein n=1 Tax=Streptomyces cadmiisoli TaxID=2184053 RepID=UPI0013A6C94A|nr:hypothetical protein [Streptomyces cadmiisoli]